MESHAHASEWDNSTINNLKVDATPILEDDQSLKVWIEIPDGSGQEARMRVDLRWVSIYDAVNAARNTFIVDPIFDHFGEDGYSDILVTRTIRNEIAFIVYSGNAYWRKTQGECKYPYGPEITILSHTGRTRP